MKPEMLAALRAIRKDAGRARMGGEHMKRATPALLIAIGHAEPEGDEPIVSPTDDKDDDEEE